MIGFHSQIGANSNESSGTTLSVTLSAGASVGDLVVVVVATDNTGTTNVSTGSSETTITDSKSNTWNIGSPRAEARRGSPGVAAGAVGAVWWTVLTSALVSGDTITLTLGTARTAKAVFVERYIHESTSGGLTQSITALGNTGLGTNVSVSTVTTPSGAASLVLASIGYEGATADSLSSTDGFYFRHTKRSSGTGAATSIQANLFSGVVAPSTTRNVATTLSSSRDFAAVVVGLREANPPSASSLGYQTSGTQIAGDRLTTDEAVMRFRQYSEIGNLIHTVPDFSLITRSIANGGGASTGYAHTTITVAPATKANRYRGRFKIGSSAEFSSGNFIGLVFRYLTDGDRWEFQIWNDGGTLRLRYNKRVSLVHGFTNLGTLSSFSQTWDLEVRDDGSSTSFWYKTSAQGEGDWTQVGSTVTDSTYGTAPTTGWSLGNSVSGWNATNSGILRWEAYTASTGPATVNLTPVTATYSPVALSPAPGNVTANLTPNTATYSPVALAPTPGAVSVGLTPSSLTYATVALSPTPSAATVALTPNALTYSPIALSGQPGAVTASLTPVSATYSPAALGAAPGAVTLSLTPSTLTYSTVALSPSASGGSTVSLTPVSLTYSPVGLGLAPGAVSATLTPSTLTYTPVAVAPAPGAAAVALTPANLTYSPVGFGFSFGAVSVGLTPASSTYSPVALNPQPSTITLALTPSALTYSPVALAPTPGAASVTLSVPVLTYSTVALGVAGTTVVSLAPAVLTYSPVALAFSFGTVSASLTSANLTYAPVALGLQPGGISTNLTPATATYSPVALGLVPGAATVALTPSTLTYSPVCLAPVAGAVTVSLSPSSLTYSPVTLSAVPGAAVVALAANSLTYSPVTLSVQLGAVTLGLEAANLTYTAVGLQAAPGAITANLTPNTLTYTAVAFSFVRKQKGKWTSGPSGQKTWTSGDAGPGWTSGPSGQKTWTSEDE